MEIMTQSGIIRCNKKEPWGKFLIGYTSTRAFTGRVTLASAWSFCQVLKNAYPTLSWVDAGSLTGALFSTNTVKDSKTAATITKED